MKYHFFGIVLQIRAFENITYLYEKLIVFGTMNTTAFNSEKYKF